MFTREIEYYFGLDLGQKKSFSAIAIVERTVERERYHNPVTYAQEWEDLGPAQQAVRHLERFPLETSYVDVVDRVKQMLWHKELRGSKTKLVVDATGAGAPVVDLFRRDREITQVCDLTAMTITSGAQATKGRGPGDWMVPKQDLMSGLALMFEERRILIARGLAESRQLVEELVRYGREDGYRDDLALALAMACWKLRQDHESETKKRGPMTARQRQESEEILGAIMAIPAKRFRE